MPKKSKKNKNFKKHISRILSILQTPSALNYKQISMKLGIHNPSKRAEVIECLHFLLISNQIEEVKRGFYTIKTNNKYYKGIFDLSSNGSGYVTSADFKEDVYIPSNKTIGSYREMKLSFMRIKEKKEVGMKEKLLKF